MRMSVYLGEDNIQVVTGKPGKKIRISSCASYPLREGTLINDVVTDEACLLEVLEEIGNSYRPYKGQVYLMLGSSKIITRVLSVPLMSQRALLKLAKRELKAFSRLETGEEMVYDYSVLKPLNKENKGGTILCAAMGRDMITEYKGLFQTCGMKIKAIDITANAMARMSGFLPALENKTFILSTLDGRNMMSFLYTEGNYVHTSRIRLLSERSGRESSDEIIKEVEAIAHFYRSQMYAYELNVIYFCGLTRDESETLLKRVSQSLNLKAEVLDDRERFLVDSGCDFVLSDYIYATGNFLDIRK